MTSIIYKFALGLFFIFTSSSQSIEDAERQLYRADGSSINFYIKKNLPGSHSNTLLIIVQGSDCNSVLHNRSVDDLKPAWPGADLLLVDKYGITPALPYNKNAERKDCPTTYLEMDSLEQRVSDILQVIKKIESTSSYRNYLMIGGSEGAVVANAVASRSKLINATVAFNGGGRWFLDDVIHSIKKGRKESPELLTEIEGFTSFASQIISNPEIKIIMSGHGSRWWRSVLQFDQLKQLGKVESPLLVIQSDNDQSVSVKSTDEMMALLFKNGKQNIDYKKYAGLDHSFREFGGESRLADVVVDINKWFATKIEFVSNAAQ